MVERGTPGSSVGPAEAERESEWAAKVEAAVAAEDNLERGSVLGEALNTKRFEDARRIMESYEDPLKQEAAKAQIIAAEARAKLPDIKNSREAYRLLGQVDRLFLQEIESPQAMMGGYLALAETLNSEMTMKEGREFFGGPAYRMYIRAAESFGRMEEGPEKGEEARVLVGMIMEAGEDRQEAYLNRRKKAGEPEERKGWRGRLARWIKGLGEEKK